jgi:hypothetical protein
MSTRHQHAIVEGGSLAFLWVDGVDQNCDEACRMRLAVQTDEMSRDDALKYVSERLTNG